MSVLFVANKKAETIATRPLQRNHCHETIVKLSHSQMEKAVIFALLMTSVFSP